MAAPCKFDFLTTVFVATTRLWKTKHTRKRFQNFRQSCVLLTDRIEIHQLQPLVWPSNLLCVMLSGCHWWISIPSVNNTQDWRKFCIGRRVMYQSNRSLSIPTGRPPGHLNFWKIFVKIPPSRGRKAVQMPHYRSIPGDQILPPPGKVFSSFYYAPAAV